MAKSHNLCRTRLVALILLVGALLLAMVPMSGRVASLATPQGKGGEVVAKPTPTPKKTTTTKRGTPARKTGPEKSPSDSAAAGEMIFWNTIKDSTNSEDFRAYLKKYPNGQFSDLATNRMKVLEVPKPQPSPAATPSPTPEPVYEWAKPERDLPASVRLEFHERKLSFSVPSGWTRTKREEGFSGNDSRLLYLQINFRAPDSPQTNVSIQCYRSGIPHTLRGGAAELWHDENKSTDDRRSKYASQKVSAKLTDTEVINHPTGRWHAFTADVLDDSALYSLVPLLDAVYPDDVWLKKTI